jgi:hypothetical protein
MASSYAKQSFSFICVAIAALLFVPSQSFGQGGTDGGDGGTTNNGGNFFLGVVGGVSVDAQRVVRGEYRSLPAADQARIREALGQADADISSATSLRMISMKGLEEAIASAHASGKPLPADVQYLAGLQRIEYVVLSPENNDIIIAGPGEGWKTNDEGIVVGVESGMPVLHLQDLMVAMRSVDSARQGQGVSVSIDPTAEGITRVREVYARMRNQGVRSVSKSLATEIEQAYGDQQVSLTGVPRDSHFSRVLLTADYKMKRLAMGLDESPLRQLPSMMSVIARKKINLKNSAPRMWMECDYEPVAKNSDGNIWHISGKGVRVQTEDELADAMGQRKGSGKKLKVAENWAKNMTKHYDALSEVEPVFRDLRNVMDMSVVAAIIKNEDLANKVGLDLPMIGGEMATPSYTVPEKIPSQVSVANSYAVQVSGGVLLDSWGAAKNTVVNDKITEVAAVATVATADRWWWNAKN